MPVNSALGENKSINNFIMNRNQMFLATANILMFYSFDLTIGVKSSIP